MPSSQSLLPPIWEPDAGNHLCLGSGGTCSSFRARNWLHLELRSLGHYSDPEKPPTNLA